MVRELYQIFIARAFQFLFWTMRVLPRPLSYGLGSLAALAATPFLLLRDLFTGPKRTSIRRNLRIAFGADISEGFIIKMTFRFLRHVAWHIIDLSRLPLFTFEDLEATVPEGFKLHRKRKDRAAREDVAAENRARFGRSKDERDLTKARDDKAAKDLDAHKRED